MSYNGWANWETWQIPLWIDNEYGQYQARCEWLDGLSEPPTAGETESFCREMYPNGTPDMDGPRELGAVDWQEIADHWAEEWRERHPPDIWLGDDGTLDTVFTCMTCGEDLRCNYAYSTEGCDDNDVPDYDDWVDKQIAELTEEHRCFDEERP